MTKLNPIVFAQLVMALSAAGIASSLQGGPVSQNPCYTWPHSLYGSSANDQFGITIKGINDIDGDGVRDLIVASPVYQLGAGKVTVYSGASISQGGPQVIREHFGSGNEDFGRAISVVGDLSNPSDGIPEYLIAARGTAPYVFDGSSGSVIWTGSADQTANNAPLGDVNGDGVPDFMVSDRFAGQEQLSAISGINFSVLYTITEPASSTNFGVSAGSVCTVDDLDGDSVQDLVVGDPTFTSGPIPSQVHIYSGSNGSFIRTVSTTDGDGFGRRVSSVGDTNSDGFADFAVGAHLYDGIGIRSGRVAIISGNPVGPEELMSFEGEAASINFGYSVASGHDLDGDGLFEIAIGAVNGGQNSRGVMYVYSGTLTGSVLWKSLGDYLSNNMGHEVAFLGDLSGDNVSEFAGGAPGADLNGASGFRVESGV